MSIDNPYESPAAEAANNTPIPMPRPYLTDDEQRKLLFYAQHLLRWSGVTFVAQGIVGVVAAGSYVAVELAAFSAAGEQVSGGASIAVGLYLAMGGQWVLERVF